MESQGFPRFLSFSYIKSFSVDLYFNKYSDLSIDEITAFVEANPNDEIAQNRLDHLLGAAARGCPISEYRVFCLLYESEKDSALAFKMLLSSAEEGFEMAHISLGSVFTMGLLGHPIDTDESFRWYIRAAAAGVFRLNIPFPIDFA